MRHEIRYKTNPATLLARLLKQGFSAAFIRLKLDMNTVIVKRR
jgi:hypothetical protein